MVQRVYERAKPISLGSESGWSESFLQQEIANDPSILGLGELVLRDRERRQSRAGRLDLLLQDSEGATRYEVELQLGATDESHIIRTIEYWDLERRRFPRYEHFAVLIAEDITSRFFNVISLFNQNIPLIAIKVSAFEVNGKATLIFTKVLDYRPSEFEDEEPAFLEADRLYWENRTSLMTMASVDTVASILSELDPSIRLKFNKGYIRAEREPGRGGKVLTFWPQKRALKFSLPSEQSQGIEESLELAGIDYEGYDERRQRYVPRLLPNDAQKHREILKEVLAPLVTSTQRDRALAEDEV